MKPDLSEARELAAAKFASSGLDVADAVKLGMDALTPFQTQSLSKGFHEVPSIRIPYFDPRNPLKPLRPRADWPDFFRLRYLKEPPQGFVPSKPLRYVQPAHSGVCAYFPRNLDWSAILDDFSQPILITEGEFKAAKACKEGYATIGLGGVYNFKSSHNCVPFLPELEGVAWARRHVYIAFDSDFRTNKNVCRALNELSIELEARGAMPHLVPLPEAILPDPKAKTGLDDFLVYRPSDDLGTLLREASYPLTLAKPLLQLNEEVTYVLNPGMIVVEETNQKISPEQFKNHAFSHVRYTEQVLKENGSVSLKPASAAAAWLQWPLRRQVGRLTYAPGQPKHVEGESVRTSAYNTWPGWGVEPKEDPEGVDPFLGLLDHLFNGASEEAKTWFLRWCAYPIQNPGTKMFSSAVIHGRAHGSGKSLLGYTLGRIYGKNFTEIKQSDLHASFNEWAENKQFILGDDVTGSDKRSDADMLKKLITQRELRLNPKYVPSYTVPDCINYLWTSNQPDAFFLEDEDRRFFIHEVISGKLDEEFYMDYNLWIDAGGSQAIFHYLLNLDLGDFNPNAPALRTTAKDRMTEDTRSDLGSWVRALINDPEHTLRIGTSPVPGDLFTSAALLKLYDPEEKRRLTANGLGRELSRAGVRQVMEGKTVDTPDGKQRLYAIRNADHWLAKDVTASMIRDHLVSSKPKSGKGKF